MQAKPHKSEAVALLQQLTKLIGQKTKQPTDLDIQLDRVIKTLGINQQQIAAILTANPCPDLSMLSREEVESYMASGAKLLPMMSGEELAPHLYRILSDRLERLREIKRLRQQPDYMLMLSRVYPGLSLEQMDASQRTFILYLAKTLSIDCDDKTLHEMVWESAHYLEQISQQLDSGLIHIAIDTLDDAELKDFFSQIIEPPTPRPYESIQAKMARQLKKYGLSENLSVNPQ
jgi:hypothetical protein